MGVREAREAGEGRLVGAALRCYPARWRRRHADEAAELAMLLIRDGSPAALIAWSYLAGAAREWLIPRPRRSLSTVAASLLAVACLFGFSAALAAETVPATAGTTQPPSGPVRPAIKPTPGSAAASSPHQLTPCRSVLPRRVSGAIPAASDPQPGTQGTARAHAC